MEDEYSNRVTLLKVAHLDIQLVMFVSFLLCMPKFGLPRFVITLSFSEICDIFQLMNMDELLV